MNATYKHKQNLSFFIVDNAQYKQVSKDSESARPPDPIDGWQPDSW